MQGIHFIGLLHSHFAGVKTLSHADINYIQTIMTQMPDEVSVLYFPLFVFPQRELIAYKAQKGRREIVFEPVEVID